MANDKTPGSARRRDGSTIDPTRRFAHVDASTRDATRRAENLAREPLLNARRFRARNVDAKTDLERSKRKMSVVGIDFGNANNVVALARRKGIDVVLNDESKRETPSMINFGDKQARGEKKRSARRATTRERRDR